MSRYPKELKAGPQRDICIPTLKIVLVIIAKNWNQPKCPSKDRYWMLGAGALGRPRGMEWGGRREEGSGWGTHVYLWRIHFDIWQN